MPGLSIRRRRLPVLTVAALMVAWPVEPTVAVQSESPIEGQVAAISQTLDRLHAAAAMADGKSYFALFADDAVFIGTDASERWTLDQFRAYALPLFANGQGWTYHPRKRQVTVAAIPCKCIAWFDEILDNAKYGTSRGTGVLILTADGWKIEQYALTFPLPNAMAADVTRKIRGYEAAHR